MSHPIEIKMNRPTFGTSENLIVLGVGWITLEVAESFELLKMIEDRIGRNDGQVPCEIAVRQRLLNVGLEQFQELILNRRQFAVAHRSIYSSYRTD